MSALTGLHEAHKAIDAQFSQSLSYLKELVHFPSISAHGFESVVLQDVANWLVTICKDFGFSDVAQVKLPGAAPYVIVHIPSPVPQAPTVLIYAHYDVQPTGEERLWQSPPFAATERHQRIFGRGTADDKAGIIATLAAARAIRTCAKEFPVNLKFLFDGEEECGSPHMERLLRQQKKALKADYLIVPDLVNPDATTPSLTFSLRGLIEFKIKIRSLKTPLHSGLGGGVIPDPTATLAKLYANALGKNGEVILPGLRIKPKKEHFMANAIWPKTFPLCPGVKMLTRNSRKFQEALWFSPALTLLQTQIAEPRNYANRIQSEVEAVFSLRIGPRQNPEKVIRSLQHYFLKNVPYGCKVEMKITHQAPGFFTDPQELYFKMALEALSDAYGKKAVAVGAGLTIPLVPLVQRHLGKMRTILLGIEDPQSNAHAENESISIAMFRNTIHAMANLWHSFVT